MTVGGVPGRLLRFQGAARRLERALLSRRLTMRDLRDIVMPIDTGRTENEKTAFDRRAFG